MSVNPTILGPGSYSDAQNSFTITIPTPVAPPPPTLQITTTSLPSGEVGDAYSASLTASGGVPPYLAWEATGLPTGLSIANTGVISGTPAAAYAGSVTFGVLDSANNAASVSLELTIAAAPPPPTWSLLTGFFVSAMTQAAEESASPVPLQIISVYANGPDYVTYSPPDLSAGLRLCVSVGACTAAQATTIGKALVAAGHPDAIIRIMWEFNDNSFPWKSLSSSAYVSQFQGAAAAFKAVSPDFVVCWCPNNESTISTAWYPGASADWIGMDIYDFEGYQNSMGALIAFGKAQGKPVFLGEWGLNGSDDTTFMNYMCGAITNPANNFAGHVYFSFAGAINSLLTKYPSSQAIFRAAFAT